MVCEPLMGLGHFAILWWLQNALFVQFLVQLGVVGFGGVPMGFWPAR